MAPVSLVAGAMMVIGVAFGGQASTQARVADSAAGPASQVSVEQMLRDMPQYMKDNHGMYDNYLTALYEQQLAGTGSSGSGAAAGSKAPNSAFSPLYGPDVRMSNSSFAGNQNEFQIDINPLDTRFAIGTSNDGRTAGVGIYKTSDRGLTWTAEDAAVYGVPAACCDPAVSYGPDGEVYVGVLDTSPAGQYTLYSTDNGATFVNRGLLAMPDRNNIVVDKGPTSPRRGSVYVTYFNSPTGRIQGYRSDDHGVTWIGPFNIGGPPPSGGYRQSSQPRVASDGTVYVGFQEYISQSVGCSAGVNNVVAKSTDGGATWTETVINIVQGGACSSAQAGRGIFCINTAGSSFRSRSHPIMGVHPTNPNIVYMFYTGGDLESAYTCAGSTGFHSDALFRKSTDGGATFSAPIKINSDPQGKDQYYGWLDVAPNGTIWAGWHDRREDPNNFQHRWYQASSTDEGATWSESPVADVMSQPSTFIGDYAGLAAKNDIVMGMWWDSRSTASGDPYTDPLNIVPLETPTVTVVPPTLTATATNTAVP
ncbi:MAG TPA: sialidase family protein, partial [Chloroflexia bacterium]|nr:sialidase family protein [Chloroflexia bacterium]